MCSTDPFDIFRAELIKLTESLSVSDNFCTIPDWFIDKLVNVAEDSFATSVRNAKGFGDDLKSIHNIVMESTENDISDSFANTILNICSGV